MQVEGPPHGKNRKKKTGEKSIVLATAPAFALAGPSCQGGCRLLILYHKYPRQPLNNRGPQGRIATVVPQLSGG